MATITTDQKYDQLTQIIAKARSAVVAFSGGVDSTFLLAACVDQLKNRVLAVTSDSELLPRHELTQARELAQRLGCEHLIVASGDLAVAGVTDNPPERCYFCKRERFIQIKQIAKARGYDWVFDGSNIDDAKDYRPGRKAVMELGIRSPLVEAALGKADIRILSKALNLTTWDQPSAACLASRIPYHTTITRNALTQIETAENMLRQLGLREFRVRHHEVIARIELGEKEMRLLLEKNLGRQIVASLEKLGYQYVTLDLKGYRTGSMNEVLSGLDSHATDD